MLMADHELRRSKNTGRRSGPFCLPVRPFLFIDPCPDALSTNHRPSSGHLEPTRLIFPRRKSVDVLQVSLEIATLDRQDEESAEAVVASPETSRLV